MQHKGLIGWEIDSKLIVWTSGGTIPIAFGAFDYLPTKSEILNILKYPTTFNLAKIMFIHFKFSLLPLRDLRFLNKEPTEPVGKLREIAANWKAGRYKNEPKDFFIKVTPSKIIYIADTIFYESDLYLAPGRRGRLEKIGSERSTQMGLMLKSQQDMMTGLSCHSGVNWGADAREQSADLNSPYTLDLINNDTVYVSGPSGMTGLLLGQMEMLCNFDNIADKQNYLTGIVAYLGAGGFHSMHEVLGPAQHVLELVPGYNIQVPNFDTLAPAPNFHQFMTQQQAIDPQFEAVRELAWQNLLDFYKNHYLPKSSAAQENLKIINKDFMLLVFLKPCTEQCSINLMLTMLNHNLLQLVSQPLLVNPTAKTIELSPTFFYNKENVPGNNTPMSKPA